MVAPCGYPNAFFHNECLEKMRINEELSAWKNGILPNHRCPHCNVNISNENSDEQNISRVQSFVEDEFRLNKTEEYGKKRLVHQVFERGGILIGEREAFIVKRLLGGILDSIHKHGLPEIGVTVKQSASVTKIEFRKKSNKMMRFTINLCRVAYVCKNIVFKDGFDVILMKSKIFNLRKRSFR